MKPRLLCLFLLGACGAPQHAKDAPAELVLRGGDVITMDAAAPRATAVAIAGGRIVAVGDDAAIGRMIGPQTRVIELVGRTVTPGMVDAHAHLVGLGTSLENVSLKGVATEAEAIALVSEAAAGRAPGEWVLGRGWDQNLWGGEFPTHEALDAAIPGNPVSLRRIDGHALWANAVALELAGVTRETKDPDGGRILRDASGAPTGVLVDNAMDLVEAKIPAPPADVIERRIRNGAAFAAARGLTGVHEMGIEPDVEAVYRALEGELPLRVNAYVGGTPAVAKTLRTRAPAPDDGDDGDDWFSLRGVKLYADGALGSRGGALEHEYADEPGHHGNWVTSPEELHQAVRDSVEGGWQTAIHAIGDAAIHETLDAYAEVTEPGSDLRLRVEHVQIIAPEDVPRFAELGVLASMQPSHATSDMPWAEARVGAERIAGGYAWRTLLDAGATIVGGSDFPIEEVGAQWQLYAAVTRQDPDGNPAGGWYPAQRMTLDEAIRAYTVAPAYAAFVEADRGQIRVGMVADLTVFDRALAPDHTLLDAIMADYTIVGGRVIVDREASE